MLLIFWLQNAFAMDPSYQSAYNLMLEKGMPQKALEVLMEGAENQNNWALRKIAQIRKATDYTKMPDKPRPDDIAYLLIAKDPKAERHFQIAENFKGTYAEEAIKFYFSASELGNPKAKAELEKLKSSAEYANPPHNSLCYFLVQKNRELLAKSKSKISKTLDEEYFDLADPYNQQQGSKQLLEAVARGEKDANFALGMNFCYGKRGFKVDLNLGLRHLLLAAIKEHVLAQYFSGMILLAEGKSRGKPNDVFDEGLKLITCAAEAGVPDAQCLLATQILEDHSAPDIKKAIKLYELAIEKGHVESMFRLGQFHIKQFKNSKREKDKTTGIELMKEAADRGFPNGYSLLARCVHSLNPKKGTENLDKLARKELLTGRTISLLLEDNDSFLESSKTTAIFNELKKKADNGDIEAQIVVADRFSKGVGIERDPVQAAKYFKLAFNNDMPDNYLQKPTSLINNVIGKLFLQNPSLTNSASEAFHWLEKAVAAGFTESFFYMGLCFLRGIGVPRELNVAKVYQGYPKSGEFFGDIKKILSLSPDEQIMDREQLYEMGKELMVKNPTKALALLILAAHLGHAGAQYEVACAYLAGIGTTINRPLSAQWLKTAAESGNKDAIAQLNKSSNQSNAKEPRKKKAYKKGQARYIEVPLAGLANISPDYQGNNKITYSFDELLQAAHGADSQALFEVGKIYYYGNDETAKNWQLAKRYLIAFLADNVDELNNNNDVEIAKELILAIDGNWKYNPKTILSERNAFNLDVKYCYGGKNLANLYELPIKVKAASVSPPVLPLEPEINVAIKFSRTPNFSRNLKALRLTSTDVSHLEELIAEKPGCHFQLKQFDNKPIFKIKFRVDNILSGRAIYQYDEAGNRVRLLLAYSKSSQENTTHAHISYLRQAITSPWKHEK